MVTPLGGTTLGSQDRLTTIFAAASFLGMQPAEPYLTRLAFRWGVSATPTTPSGRAVRNRSS